nr:siderophore-interacting protein [Mesorhizobium sp.]
MASPAWPSDDRRPVARVYTIRALDVEKGIIEVDFLIHPGDSVGARWAMQAAPGMKIGIMGPVGRPVRPASWYLMGADETGLPALARMLETLPAETKGVAFVRSPTMANGRSSTTRPALSCTGCREMACRPAPTTGWRVPSSRSHGRPVRHSAGSRRKRLLPGRCANTGAVHWRSAATKHWPRPIGGGARRD